MPAGWSVHGLLTACEANDRIGETCASAEDGEGTALEHTMYALLPTLSPEEE